MSKAVKVKIKWYGQQLVCGTTVVAQISQSIYATTHQWMASSAGWHKRCSSPENARAAVNEHFDLPLDFAP